METSHFQSVEMEWVTCPLCGSAQSQPLFIGRDFLLDLPGEFPVVRCPTCQLVYANPRPTLQSLKFFYPDYYGPYQPDANRLIFENSSVSLARRLTWAVRNALLNRYLGYSLPVEFSGAQNPLLLSLA